MTETPQTWLTQREFLKQNPGLKAGHIRAAVRAGLLPAGVQLGPRLRAWPAEQLRRLLTPTTA